jgi:hypothetical protein
MNEWMNEWMNFVCLILQVIFSHFAATSVFMYFSSLMLPSPTLPLYMELIILGEENKFLFMHIFLPSRHILPPKYQYEF